jgi:hypothetical protein
MCMSVMAVIWNPPTIQLLQFCEKGGMILPIWVRAYFMWITNAGWHSAEMFMSGKEIENFIHILSDKHIGIQITDYC